MKTPRPDSRELDGRVQMWTGFEKNGLVVREIPVNGTAGFLTLENTISRPDSRELNGRVQSWTGFVEKNGLVAGEMPINGTAGFLTLENTMRTSGLDSRNLDDEKNGLNGFGDGRFFNLDGKENLTCYNALKRCLKSVIKLTGLESVIKACIFSGFTGYLLIYLFTEPGSSPLRSVLSSFVLAFVVQVKTSLLLVLRGLPRRRRLSTVVLIICKSVRPEEVLLPL